MITGSRDVISLCSSWVLPTADGNYTTPPATVIETFWAYKRNCCEMCSGVKKVSYGGELGWIETCPRCHGNGYLIVANDDDMVLMYKLVDPTTFSIIPFSDGVMAKEVTAEMVGSWVNTKFHSHFISGQEV